MSLSTDGRYSAAKVAELGDDYLADPETAPLFTTVITVTQPAVSAEHARELCDKLLDSEYGFISKEVELIDIEISESVEVAIPLGVLKFSELD